MIKTRNEKSPTVATAPRGLPRFQVASGPRAEASAAAAATAASAMPASVLALLATIQADDPAGISLLLRDHRVVRWGGPEPQFGQGQGPRPTARSARDGFRREQPRSRLRPLTARVPCRRG